MYEGESDSGPSTARQERRAGPAPTTSTPSQKNDSNAKSRKQPEITLPDGKAETVDDAEIEWLEYMVKKEKNKAQPDDLDDGLDGESSRRI